MVTQLYFPKVTLCYWSVPACILAPEWIKKPLLLRVRWRRRTKRTMEEETWQMRNLTAKGDLSFLAGEIVFSNVIHPFIRLSVCPSVIHPLIYAMCRNQPRLKWPNLFFKWEKLLWLLLKKLKVVFRGWRLCHTLGGATVLFVNDIAAVTLASYRRYLNVFWDVQNNVS